MSTKNFDVIVIGGGPAGSAAARTLAAAGVDVCIVDKAKFPRDKLCGGLLTPRSKKIFEKVFQADWSPATHATSTGARFYFRDTIISEVKDYKELSFTCRREFDAFLVALATGAGASLIDRQHVQTVDLACSAVQLSDGRRLHYKCLIGADGVNSVVARTLFGTSFNKKNIGFGYEIEVPTSERYASVDYPEIYFGLLNWGYAWVFPKRGTLTVGIGGVLRKNPKMKSDFEMFLSQRFGNLPTERIKGHHVPFGDFLSVPGREAVLLCGDAAGLVEPITGEGIAFAMQSGLYAADAVIEALQLAQPRMALAIYRESYARIAASFRWANVMRWFLFPSASQFLFSRVLRWSESIPRRHMDLMADEISYPDYARFLVRKLASGAIRRLVGN